MISKLDGSMVKRVKGCVNVARCPSRGIAWERYASSPETNLVIPSCKPHFAISRPRLALSFGRVEKMA